MALYTILDGSTLNALCAAFGLGALREAVGIPQGSINTNYRLETDTGRYFLRHTHVRSESDLVFEAALLRHLEEAAVPAPRLRTTLDGRAFVSAVGGHVSLFGWLAGEERTRGELTPQHLEQLGHALAKLHVAATSFPGARENPYGPRTVRAWIEELVDHADPEVWQTAVELTADLEEIDAVPPGLEPRGVIHADLFLDNVKWVGDRVSALFDFEMACVEAFGLDLAITLNAWCFDEGAYRWELVRALLRGYEEVRPLSELERVRLRQHARFGAVRFCLSRIRDFHLSPLPPERLARKDFRTYLARARLLRALTDAAFVESAFSR